MLSGVMPIWRKRSSRRGDAEASVKEQYNRSVIGPFSPVNEILFKPKGNNEAQVAFNHPQRALAKGQVIALYDGEKLLGGGIYR